MMWSVLRCMMMILLCVVDFGDNFLHQKRAHWTGGADDVVNWHRLSCRSMYNYVCRRFWRRIPSLMWSNVHRLSCRCVMMIDDDIIMCRRFWRRIPTPKTSSLMLWSNVHRLSCRCVMMIDLCVVDFGDEFLHQKRAH